MSSKQVSPLMILVLALFAGLAIVVSVSCHSSGSSTEPGDRSSNQASEQTIAASVTCTPQFNTLPATINTCVHIRNLVDSPRVVDGRIDLWLGSGSTPLYQWRFREVTMGPQATWDNCWNNNLQDLPSLEDKNIARLRVVDVTPPPYNQPPYPPSGYAVEDACFFWGNHP